MSEEQRRTALRLFLKERRARVQPADVGIPPTARRRVRGLRREEVAALAGIGVSWYTALENGDAEGVSQATLLAVSQALRLSESEQHYLLALGGSHDLDQPIHAPGPPGKDGLPSTLALATLHALTIPAYLITPTWNILHCNDAFCRVWDIERSELPLNAIERLFLHPKSRKMHGAHFEQNITPVIAMLRSSHGRQLDEQALVDVRDKLLEDEVTHRIWQNFGILSPLLTNECTIESPIGIFRYEAMTLPIPGYSHGLVVQVPNEVSMALFGLESVGDAV
jgi:transcriptional regulator with XRE-family HTH domain